MSDSETPSGLRKALNIGPNTKVHLTLGTLYGGASALLTAAFFIWNLNSKIDAVANDVAGIRQDLKPMIEHTAVLWDDHQRQASVWRKP